MDRFFNFFVAKYMD